MGDTVSETARPAVVSDVLHARLQAPDLDEAEEFLVAFGMVRSARTDTKLFMRGTGTAHHVYVAELGPPRFVGLGFAVDDKDALERLAELPGASPVHDVDEPGGGRRVTLQDPDGYSIEVIHGQAAVAPIDVPQLPTNSAHDRARRVGRGPWGPDQPPHVLRFGHAVLKSTRFEETLAFYEQTLGLVRSDEGIAPDGTLDMVFLRIDGGARYVDHHAMQLAKTADQTGMHHVSYEVHSWSEVFEGAAHLDQVGKYKQWVPPIRHYVGGQVGAYFADPWGRLHEFWADGDVVNDSHVPEQWTLERVLSGPNWVTPDLEFFMQVHP